ncbi:MAG: YbaK/EbsC family protein [Gracilibacteraceae bacterium]|jgi:prolyl-tRNA editing enzyme YbaK/EbsC (Cys-tRNA(Pro) deacylase)|nr:YbaK/EbsC family protein [Gracilibacteraceae bacterium]
MSVEAVKEYFSRFGLAGRVMEFPVSSATVELAAAAVGVEPARIAKTLSLRRGEDCVLLVTAGDVKIDNHKFRDFFQFKARMLAPDEVLRLTGHAVGGVCPFALPPGTEVYADESLRRFTTVFPACGSGSSAIELTPDELARYADIRQWVDVCRGASSPADSSLSPRAK